MRSTRRHGPRARGSGRWLLGSTLVAVALALTAAAAAAVVLATSGVFDRRPGAWTVPLRLLPGVTVQANASGLLRLATSPIGLRLLDGRARTTAVGTLRFARIGDSLQLRCAPCRLHDARVAARPVVLPAAALWLTRRTGVESNNVIDARLAAADVQATAVLTLAPTGVDVQWQLPGTPVARLVGLFVDAVPEARRAQIEGTLRADGRFSLPFGLPGARSAARAHVEHLAVAGLGTEQLATGSVTVLCTDARGTAGRVSTGEPDRQWVPPEAFGSWLPAAVLAAEDPRFDTHAGIDEASIVRALTGAPQERGTLTQQLARTLYTGRDGTLAGLLRELLYASEMERTLGKDRILALHLNTVAWGPGACGARAAARLYFGKRVSQLTPLEAAWLAGILRDPQRAWQQQVLGGVVDHERTHWVLAQLRALPRAERDKWQRQSIAFTTRGPLPLAVAGQTAP